MLLIYLIIALLATTVGALTGMGGGVMIKPLLDVLGQFPAATINLLSSLTVLSMSVVSVGRHVKAKTPVNYKIAVLLAAGSVAGGLLGDALISTVIEQTGTGNEVTLIQNSILAFLIVIVFFYIKFKSKLPTLGVKGTSPAVFVGLFLGCISSFLGIGGGPINVAVLAFVFSMNTKDAAICSLVIILFSQFANFIAGLVSGVYWKHDLSILPVMIIGAIGGGFLGAYLQRKFTEKQVEKMFNGVQLIVLAMCFYNIIRNG